MSPDNPSLTPMLQAVAVLAADPDDDEATASEYAMFDELTREELVELIQALAGFGRSAWEAVGERDGRTLGDMLADLARNVVLGGAGEVQP